MATEIFICDVKTSSYIAQYPVLRTVQSALHFTSLTDLFTQTPSRLLWKTFSHVLQLMRECCSYTYPPYITIEGVRCITGTEAVFSHDLRTSYSNVWVKSTSKLHKLSGVTSFTWRERSERSVLRLTPSQGFSAKPLAYIS